MSRYTSKTSELRAQRAAREYSELVDLRAERERLRRLLVDGQELLEEIENYLQGESHSDARDGALVEIGKALALIRFERGG